PGRLRAWLVDWGLAPAGRVSDDDLARARELRESLHGLARAAAAHEAATRSDPRTVNAALLDDPPTPLRRRGDTPVARRPPATPWSPAVPRRRGSRSRGSLARRSTTSPAPMPPGCARAATTSAPGSSSTRRDVAAGAPTSGAG